MTFRVTPRAARDLDQIAAWTLANWGRRRMETYLRKLNRRFAWLARNPHAGPDRSEIAAGYRSFPEGGHNVFYVIDSGGIAIIGGLRQAMDVAARLRSGP